MIYNEYALKYAKYAKYVNKNAIPDFADGDLDPPGGANRRPCGPLPHPNGPNPPGLQVQSSLRGPVLRFRVATTTGAGAPDSEGRPAAVLGIFFWWPREHGVCTLLFGNNHAFFVFFSEIEYMCLVSTEDFPENSFFVAI